jgi:hypothetical protein
MDMLFVMRVWCMDIARRVCTSSLVTVVFLMCVLSMQISDGKEWHDL